MYKLTYKSTTGYVFEMTNSCLIDLMSLAKRHRGAVVTDLAGVVYYENILEQPCQKK